MMQFWIATYTLLALAPRSGHGQNLNCHCKIGSRCDSNGYCTNGCEAGWYGPGCQVGNIAFLKQANQSSDYITNYGYSLPASFAVDGIPYTNDRNYPNFCSHTSDSTTDFPWWYVTLSNSQDYVITNVSIANRPGPAGQRLKNFYILYTNDTSTPPNPRTWRTCVYQNATPADFSTYQCINGSVIARAVGIYIGISPDNNKVLTLCEVYVYGYSYSPCPVGFTGPGCLLRPCNSDCSGSCNEFGGCNFIDCPSKALLPPDCWKTLPDLSNYAANASATCTRVRASFQLPSAKPNYPATSLIFTVSSSVGTTIKQVALQPLSDMAAIELPASLAQSYTVVVTPFSCGIQGINCTYGSISRAVTVTTGKWTYWSSNNESCFFATVNSTTVGCELPSIKSLQCKAISAMSNTSTTNSSDLSCGLALGEEYNCSVIATARNTTEIFSVVITPNHMSFENTYLTPSPNTSGNNVEVVIGSVVGGAVLVILTVIIFFVIRRCKTNTAAESQRPANIQNLPLHQFTDGENNAYQSDYEEPTNKDAAGMTLLQFEKYIKDEALILKRFSELQASENYPCMEGKEPGNKAKNRFQNIIPYDLNRVCLEAPGRGYINASYIDGIAAPKQYIATQGPSAKTIDDFWHMLWQERCKIVVMLTDYVEKAKSKCEKYFPLVSSPESEISVNVRSATTYDTHRVTELEICCGDEIRTVHHYHFLSWPDHSGPEHCAQLLLFYWKIRQHMKLFLHGSGPVVVHCSAGVGRTGAYIAFDYLQQCYESQGRVDVDSCILKLRDQRMQMVQTKDLYVFVHKAVHYGVRTLKYMFDASQLPEFVDNISGSPKLMQSFSQEWQELQSCMQPFDTNNFSVANLEENTHKNRSMRVLADDSWRPILASASGTSQDYINAVYCNCCYSNRGFIATQLPLPATITDFWHMVYECQPSCIVLLHDLPFDKDCPRYWPKPGHSLTSVQLVVTSDDNWQDADEKSGRGIAALRITVEMVSKRGEQVTTMLFMPKLWTSYEDELPTEVSGLLDVAHALTPFFKDKPKQPVIVQCRDGASQCGLFLSAVNALHMLMESGQVCVFHIVDLLRARRREFVKSETQYRFIYQFLMEHLEATATYANTKKII